MSREEREADRARNAAWQRALALEAEGKFPEAEKAILDSIDHLGAFGRVAYLYEVRMRRLQSGGNVEGAVAAFHRSNHWMWVMASGATSGGEGTALSNEATEHERKLVKMLGFDPRA
jgi:hypothetical protein